METGQRFSLPPEKPEETVSGTSETDNGFDVSGEIKKSKEKGSLLYNLVISSQRHIFKTSFAFFVLHFV